MRSKLVPNRGANAICTVGKETFLHEKVYLTEIYEAKIDRNFLGVRGLCDCRWHLLTSPRIPYGSIAPSIGMVRNYLLGRGGFCYALTLPLTPAGHKTGGGHVSSRPIASVTSLKGYVCGRNNAGPGPG